MVHGSVDGLLDVDEFRILPTSMKNYQGEEDDLYKTMDGLLNGALRSHSKNWDKEQNGMAIQLEVIDMDNTSIDKILVTYEEPNVVQKIEGKRLIPTSVYRFYEYRRDKERVSHGGPTPSQFGIYI